MSVTTLQEIETKLRFESALELEQIPGFVAERGGVFSPPKNRNVRDEYLETPDYWFFQAGLACRIRTFTGKGHRELTLKSLTRPQAGIATRTELTEKLDRHRPLRYPGRFPGHTLIRRLQPWLGDRTISPVFILDQHRRVFSARFPKTGLQVEVSLDETRLEGTPHTLYVVEFELQKGTEKDLRALTQACRKAFQSRKKIPSKFAWASRWSGIQWPDSPADSPILAVSDGFAEK